MRIYTEVIWSWDDEKGELVKESSKSYDYEGPLTLCNGSGGLSVNQRIADNSSDTGNAFTYPLGIGGTNEEYPHYIRFVAKKTNTSTPENRRGVSNGEVVLYMPPDALKTSYSQSIGDVDLGGAITVTAGDSRVQQFTGALNKASGSLGEGQLGVGKSLSALKDAAATVGSLGLDNAVAGALQKSVGALGPLGAAISKASGAIINPHKAVVYQGPGGFRTFNYTFVMMPKSPEEAQQIFKIVKFFKKRMHPGVGAAGINNVSSITLSYPDEFEIKYYVNKNEVDGSSETKPLFKIYNCFMESFSADYTTSGLTSFMEDDQPLTTTITMSFKETQLLTKSDIEQGF